jgi:hypothetical protein
MDSGFCTRRIVSPPEIRSTKKCVPIGAELKDSEFQRVFKGKFGRYTQRALSTI